MAEEIKTEGTPDTSAETVKTPGAAEGEGTQLAKATEAASGDAKFTQADIDRIVKQRLAEVSTKAERDAREKKAKEDGDYKTLLETKDTELETERANVKALTLKYEAVIVAQKLGIVKPEKVLKLIDESAIEYDSAGKPTNLERLFKAEIEEMPALVGDTSSATPGSPNRPAPAGSKGANGAQDWINSRYPTA